MPKIAKDSFIPDVPKDSFVPDTPTDSFIPDTPADSAADIKQPDAPTQRTLLQYQSDITPWSGIKVPPTMGERVTGAGQEVKAAVKRAPANWAYWYPKYLPFDLERFIPGYTKFAEKHETKSGIDPDEYWTQMGQELMGLPAELLAINKAFQVLAEAGSPLAKETVKRIGDLLNRTKAGKTATTAVAKAASKAKVPMNVLAKKYPATAEVLKQSGTQAGKSIAVGEAAAVAETAGTPAFTDPATYGNAALAWGVLGFMFSIPRAVKMGRVKGLEAAVRNVESQHAKARAGKGNGVDTYRAFVKFMQAAKRAFGKKVVQKVPGWEQFTKRLAELKELVRTAKGRKIINDMVKGGQPKAQPTLALPGAAGEATPQPGVQPVAPMPQPTAETESARQLKLEVGKLSDKELMIQAEKAGYSLQTGESRDSVEAALLAKETEPSVAPETAAVTPEVEAEVEPKSEPTVADVVRQGTEEAKTLPPEADIGPVKMVNVRGLVVDPESFQIKMEAKGEGGVTEKLTGVEQWDEVAGGALLIWQGKDGTKYVADGHHRVELRKRLGGNKKSLPMPAFVLREADGVSRDEARGIAAMTNIMAGNISAASAAKAIRDAGMTPEMMVQAGLNPRSALVQQAQMMAKLDPDAFSYAVQEGVAPNYAAVVGRELSDLSADVQIVALKEIQKAGISNEYEAEAVTRAIKAAPVLQTKNLFGVEEKSLVGERAKVEGHLISRLARDASVARLVVREKGRIEKAGSVINRAAHQALAQNTSFLVDLIQRLGHVKGPIADLLNQGAKEYALHPKASNLAAITDRVLDGIGEIDFENHYPMVAQGIVDRAAKGVGHEEEKPQVGLFGDVENRASVGGGATPQGEAAAPEAAGTVEAPDAAKPAAREAPVDNRAGFLRLRAGEPPGDASPDAPFDETKLGANELLDSYWAERDEAVMQADVEAMNYEDRIKAVAKTLGYGSKAKLYNEALQLYVDLKGRGPAQFEKWGGRLPSAKKALYGLSQNLPDSLQAIGDEIILANAEWGQDLKREGIIGNVRENYSARIWETPKEAARGWKQAKAATSSHRARARTYESVLEGWARGRELQIRGITSAYSTMREQTAIVRENRRLIELGIEMGIMGTKPKGDGWKRVPGMLKWKWAGKIQTDQAAAKELTDAALAEGDTPPKPNKIYSRSIYMTDDGDLFVHSPVYAEPELANKLASIFGKSTLYSIPGVQTLTRYNSLFKATILSTSLFHHQAFLRSYMIAARTGLGNLEPIQAYRAGMEAIRQFTPELRELVRAGLTLGRQQDWDEGAWQGESTRIGKILDGIPGAAPVKDKILEWRERQAHFLFARFGAGLKAQAGLLEYRALHRKYADELVSGKVTKQQIAEMVANLMNDDFGGLHLGRKARNPTLQHIFRLVALAPDWTESNVASMVKAFKGGKEGKIYRDFWKRVVVAGVGATMVSNLLLSFWDDKTFWEREKYAWKTGNFRWLDVDVSPIYWALGGDKSKRKYFSLLGHLRDLPRFAAQPIRTARNKGSVATRVILDLLNGQDWAGRNFTTFPELLGIDDKGAYKTTKPGLYMKGMPKGGKLAGRLVTKSRGPSRSTEWAQLPSYAAYETRGLMPIQLQELLAFLSGESDAFDAISHSLGIHTSTTYPQPERR